VLAEKWFNIWISNIVYWLVLLLTIKCIKIHMKLLALNKHITVVGTDFQDVGLRLSPAGLRTNFKSLPTKVRYVEHLSTVYEHGWSHYSAEWVSLWKWCVGCNWPTILFQAISSEILIQNRQFEHCAVSLKYIISVVAQSIRTGMIFCMILTKLVFCYMLIRIKRCYHVENILVYDSFYLFIFGIMSLLY
jgi:hypothetical protein